MAKNKKSKILAMALCASVMTGIYAAPVMAGMVLYTPTEGNLEIYISGYEDHPYSDTINFDGSSQEIYGRLNISGNNIATALTGTNLTLNSVAIGTDTINAATIARWNATARANENVGGIERSAGATTPGTGTTTIEGSTSFDATGMTVGDDKFIVDTDGNVIANSIATSGDIVTLSGDVVAGTYSLKTVGDLTQNIDSTRTTAGTTTFKGDVNVDGNVKAATGSFDRMTLNGSDIYAGGHVLKVGDQTLNFLLANRAIENTAGIERVDYGNGVGETTIEGATTFDQSGMGVYTSTGTSVVSGGQATFRDNSGGFTQIMGGNVTASGDIVSSSGEENYSLNTIGGNTAGIERTGNSKNTYTVIEDTLKVRDGYISNENESFVVNSKGDLKAANGHFHVDRYGNTKIDGDVTMAVGATVDGVDVSELGGNVAGISRNNGDLPYGQGVTTIEGVVSVDGQSGLVNFSTGNGNGVLINSSQGQIIASSVGANQIVGENLSGGNGAFRVSENGDILMQNGSGESISMTDGGLNLMSTDNGTGMVTLRDGSVSLMGNGTSTVTVDENGTTFGTVLGSETTNINGGTVTASGDFVTVDENGNEKYTLNTIGDNTQAIKYQDGVTTIGGETLAVTDEGYVTINNGAFAVGPDGMATVGNNIQLDGETGVVSANDLRANNNVYSKNYNLEEVGDNLDDLTGSVDNIGGNVAGISRNNGDLPYGQGVTTIEGVVSVDGQSGLVNFSTGNGNGVLINSSQGQIIASSVGANQIVGENLSGGNGAFRVSENGDILMQNGSGESISMTDGGLNLMSTDNGTGMVTLRDGSVSLMGNGTSTVTVDENGTTFGTVLGSETTNINGGTVTASGDFVTVDENGNEKYTLNTIGDNTQAIKYQDGVTTIGGETLAVTDEGYVTINNGAFAVGPDGMATVGNNIQLDGETGVVSANDLRANNNVYSKNYNLEEVGADLKELSGDFTTTNANVAGIKRTGSDEEGWITTIEGSTSFDANGMNVGNGAVVANSDGSFSAGNGSFKVSDGVTTIGRDTLAVTDEGYVTINNGAFAVGPDGMVAVGNSIQFDGETGVVYANDLKAYNNVYSKNYNLEEVGADLDDLTGSVGNIGDNVAGITRDAEDGALPGEGTTTIEDTLSVSGDSVLAQIGSSQLVITEDVAGLSSGNASFALSNNELQLSVAGNGLLVNQFGTNLNGTVNFIGHDGNSYTLSDLEGRVYDLEQKTQNITSAEPGQGGSSEVPPTGDGHTGFEGDVTVGGDINADEGNFNKVNTDEINVGDNTFIDGDSVNSNEGNFKDKVTVGSGENQTVINNGGITVGDSEGTSINHDEVRVGGEDGSYMNENDVVTGEGNSLNDTANRVGNLEQGVSELNNRVGELEDRIDKVGAMAAAIANLRTMGYDPAAPTEVAVGIGQYRDETGAALGLFHYPNRDFMLSLSVSTSGDEVMGGIGATWKFGRKSPEKVAEIKKAQAEADARRAEEAKLAKAEEMKQAAKEAKIKAQQERHAKLAAERAAQAEAAK